MEIPDSNIYQSYQCYIKIPRDAGRLKQMNRIHKMGLYYRYTPPPLKSAVLPSFPNNDLLESQVQTG